MINLEKMDEILAVDDVIQHIAIVDSKGNIIHSKSKNNAKNTIKDETGLYPMDLSITKQMLDVYDYSLGKTISLQTRREKINQLVYYHDYLIIYISCDAKTDNKKILEISSKIEHLVQEMMYSQQHDLKINQK
ncbi:MAG: hypothetical protein IIA83_06985 [Thaumarchaeota archaeon]|nr:hypothetical protein [Nitrososphaerota archaeon]